MSVSVISIITVSDTCSQDETKDLSGSLLVQLSKEMFPEAQIHYLIVPDEKEQIEEKLKEFCKLNVDLIITTGGTGLSSRDVTPEATKAVINREVSGITTALTIESLKKTPMAMVSRSVAGIRGKTLIINFPGSKKAVHECFEVIRPVLQHAVSVIKGNLTAVKSVHESMHSQHICPHQQITSNVDVSKVALRSRESQFPMLEMSEAFKVVDSIMKQWKNTVEVINIPDSNGRVVAEAIYAREPMPPFHASVKDGYACVSSYGAGVRRVRAAVTAGDMLEQPLMSEECVRINTGAPLPPGADCVVQVEDTKLISATPNNEIELEVEILKAPMPEQDVRPVGFDIPMGALLVNKGAVIDAAHIGMLVGAGYQQVKAVVHPKIGILSTGNELQEPYEPILQKAHIRDSNQMMLKALLKEHGFESVQCGIARDEASNLVEKLANALRRVDVLVCTGGVSMGERDLLKPVLLQDFGATIHFGRVRMKPGKPSTFATCQFEGATKYIFALPGNPVSAYVCCVLFVVRALRVCTRGASEFARLRVRLASDVRLDPRPEYARAVLRFSNDDMPTAEMLGNQCSSRLLSVCGASVLLELPSASASQNVLRAGTVVSALVTGRIDLTTN